MLAACGVLPGQQTPSSAGVSFQEGATAGRSAAAAPAEIANLDYSNGSISVFAIKNGRASLEKKFTPGNGRAQGLAVDQSGRIYTTITSTSSNPCAACVQVFTPQGKLLEQFPAPILSGAPGPPSLTDISVDAHDRIYVSDYGQQAVYYYVKRRGSNQTPTIVVQNSSNAASVLATPNGRNVLVSGGCGFASVRPYKRVSHGQYQAGSCFGIGTIALIGGAANDGVEVFTPVDGVPGLVSVSSPHGGTNFSTPDQFKASISGVALNADASIVYVANAAKECIYAFARPANGWLNGGQPKVVARYKGFRNLDIIAVQP
jgi:hypothetical protein